MLGLKVIHVNERGTRKISSALHNRCQYGKSGCSQIQSILWRHNGRDGVSTSRLFTQLFIQAQKKKNIKENIKAPPHWPLWGEFTGDRDKWIKKNIGEILYLLNKGGINHIPIILEFQFFSPYEPCGKLVHIWNMHGNSMNIDKLAGIAKDG